MPEPRYITHEAPHARPADLNPKVNGPFLDEINADRARARFDARNRDTYRHIAPETIERATERDYEEIQAAKKAAGKKK